MGNDALAHPVEEAVPFSRVMDDAGLVEGRAQNGRYRDFPAVAAAHATIVYIGPRVFLERIAAVAPCPRRAARKPDTGAIAVADIGIDPQAFLDHPLARGGGLPEHRFSL